MSGRALAIISRACSSTPVRRQAQHRLCRQPRPMRLSRSSSLPTADSPRRRSMPRDWTISAALDIVRATTKCSRPDGSPKGKRSAATSAVRSLARDLLWWCLQLIFLSLLALLISRYARISPSSQNKNELKSYPLIFLRLLTGCKFTDIYSVDQCGCGKNLAVCAECCNFDPKIQFTMFFDSKS